MRGGIGSFCESTGSRSGDGWSVIGAGDGDGDGLIDGAAVLIVVDGDGEGFGDLLSVGEVINSGIVDGVGPADDSGPIGGGVVVDGRGECAEYGSGVRRKR